MAIAVETVIAECGTRLHPGDRAYNYYEMKPGVIGDDVGPDGWFTFQHDDGTSKALNGQRICSMPFARLRNYRDADPA